MKSYECDGCGVRRRRITVHYLSGTKAHFCSIQCVHELIEDDDEFRDHVEANDIADGA
jgi:hypothetical protein